MSDLQTLCESFGKSVGRGPKMELLKVADGLNAAIILNHSYSVKPWCAPAFSFRGHEDATSIRGTGLDP